MTQPITRRAALRGASALAAGAALGAPARALAQGTHDRAVVRAERDIQTLDPGFRTSTVEGNILRAATQRLASFKPGVVEFENDAAAEIKRVSPTVIEFTLKPGLKFHGDKYGEMTADDVKFSFERFNNPPAGAPKPTYASDWGALDGVEVTGPLSGRLVLKSPAPGLWTTAICDISGSIMSRKAFEALGDKVKTQVIGTGPYVQAEWVANERLVLRANRDYKGRAPAFREIVQRPIQDSHTAQIAFQSGEIDFTRVDLTAIDQFAKMADTAMTKLNAIDYIWLGINVEKGPLSDVRVRQAIRYALDVDAALVAGYDGRVQRAKTLIPPALLGHWADAPVYARDVAKAKSLLAAAGLASGLKTRITCLNQATYRNMAQVMQASLAEAGIQAEVEALDGGSYWSSGEGDKGKQLELSIQLFKGKFDPSFYTQWFTTSQIGAWNWERWSNADYDKLHGEAAATIEAAERKAKLIRMQQLMDESAAFVWLTHDVLAFAAHKWLKPSLLPNGSDWQLADFTRV